MSREPKCEILAGEDKVVITVTMSYGAAIVWTITPDDYDLYVRGEYLNSKGEAQEENIGIRPIDTSNVVLFI